MYRLFFSPQASAKAMSAQCKSGSSMAHSVKTPPPSNKPADAYKQSCSPKTQSKKHQYQQAKPSALHNLPPLHKDKQQKSSTTPPNPPIKGETTGFQHHNHAVPNQTNLPL
jgi:hypothetical protein